MVKTAFVKTLFFFFLKYFRNSDNWPRTRQNDNFFLKYSLLLDLGHVILYFLKVMNNHDNNNHILDMSHCHKPFKIISESVSWDLLLQKDSGSAENFFLA